MGLIAKFGDRNVIRIYWKIFKFIAAQAVRVCAEDTELHERILNWLVGGCVVDITAIGRSIDRIGIAA